MITSTQTLAIILTASICTFLIRVAPFAIFAGREIPAPVQYLGKVLPATVMALLVVYCLKAPLFPLLPASCLSLSPWQWWQCSIFGKAKHC